MGTSERRRVERHRLDVQGELFLSHGRCIPVRIVDLGVLGALVAIGDLEEAVLEGERVVLGHPLLEDGHAVPGRSKTAGAVVRVDLEFSDAGVSRHVAVYFDGGAHPEACTA